MQKQKLGDTEPPILCYSKEFLPSNRGYIPIHITPNEDNQYPIKC